MKASAMWMRQLAVVCLMGFRFLTACGSDFQDSSELQDMVDTCIRHGGGEAACRAKYGASHFGNVFAENSQRVAYQMGTVGRCYEGVANAMDLTFGTSPATWSNLGIGASHAYQFSDWANVNPRSLGAVFKLRRANISPYSAPRGSLFIYEPGHCGMSAVSGHIEVKVNGSSACSDHCRTYSCDPSYVYVPL